MVPENPVLSAAIPQFNHAILLVALWRSAFRRLARTKINVRLSCCCALALDAALFYSAVSTFLKCSAFVPSSVSFRYSRQHHAEECGRVHRCCCLIPAGTPQLGFAIWKRCLFEVQNSARHGEISGGTSAEFLQKSHICILTTLLSRGF